MYRSFFKHLIDVVIALIGLIVLLIPIIIISIAIKCDSKGPVVFKQERLGKGKKVFTIYKFRTMVDHAYENGGIVNRSDDPRITKVGAFLRRTSLDEILQLVNILIGDMAIIGPRPILPVEYEEYEGNPRYDLRYEDLPGLFGTVDIKYRASATRELQFEMDAEYHEEMSLKNDVKYFFQIIRVVLSGKDVYREEVDVSEEESEEEKKEQ